MSSQAPPSPPTAPTTAATTITTTTAEADAAIRSSPTSATGTVRSNMPSKLISISTKTIFTTTTTTPNNEDQHSSSSASVSSPSSSNSLSSLSPATPAAEMMQSGLDALPAAARIATPPAVDDNNNASDEASSSDTETLEAGVTATLHKKDSGTSMGSSVVSSPIDSRPSSQTALRGADDNNCPTSPTEPAPDSTTATTATTAAAAGTRRFSQSDTPSMMSPAGRVLTRPLSTSKLSSIPLTAPHILPNQRYAGFNLAAFGQLSPSSSTAAGMTISRADSLAFLNSNSSAGSSPNPYFGISAAAMKTGGSGGTSTPNSLMEGIMLPSSSGVTRTTMCGSDAISLLDLDDSHNDIVMIDSNGNSSGSAVVGPATVVETMASASAIVSNNHASASHHHTLGGAASGLVAGLGGLTTAVSSASLLTGGGGLGGSGNGGGSGATSVLGGGSAFGSGSSSGSSISQPRSSLPSLTSQARKDVMQRAAMLAAMQQNGGAKILGAHRVGRRQDRPNRKIRFGDYHKICEIEYGFDQGKPLVANGRTLVHSTVVLRICGDEEREEQLYLFSDVLVTGTKIRKGKPYSEKSANEVPANIVSAEEFEKAKDVSADDQQQGLIATVEDSKVDLVAIAPEVKAETIQVEVSVKETLLDNPYAGHLENQQISRLTQVQADVVEGNERPMLKVSMPQSTSLLIFQSTTARDNFMSLLTETIYAHKHYLLSQSKYLADLKKFKRHSAFSFDTSFLKTWGIPGGLNLGSLRPAGGSSGHGVIGPNTFTSSPVTSPGGGAFDPYQHQQYLNRPQSMAGSLFGFALNGGPFQPFSDHSKDSSYATLRGTNAAHALQYHHQQQQMLQQQLQNRLSMSSVASGRAGGMDRTSSGSTFDALWFMKGGETVKNSRRSVVHAAAEDERDGPAEEDLPANMSSGELTTTATQPLSSSTGSSSLTVNTDLAAATAGSSSVPSRPPLSSSSSFSSIATLRNGAGWVRDEDATYCMVCTTTKFGVLIRKHHCRLCGRVICWKCCQMKDAVLLNNEQGLSPTEAAAMSQDFRKPIRVCLDCIEQNATASQEGNNNQPLQPSSPQQQSSSFPLQGVLGKLMSSTMTSSPQIVASATNATGSSTFAMPQTASAQAPFQQRGQGSTPSSFYPRIMSYSRNGNAYPHHHRASLYRIDVERVGEEDEEEEEEEEEEEQEVAELLLKADEALESLASLQPESSSKVGLATGDSVPNNQTVQDDSNTIIKSRHGSVRLKDLDPADINEEEVQNQIMNLESEVESLLIQSAAAPLMFARAGGGSGHSRHQREGGTGAGKTRVIRGIPKEMMLQYEGGGDDVDEDGEVEEDEEVSMEELLAQQDERLKQILS